MRARVNVWRFAGAGIVEIEDPPRQVVRRVQPGSLDHGYKLALHLAGRGRYRCSGYELFQAPGDLVLADTEAPFEVAHPAGTHVLIWELPRARLSPLLAATEGGRHRHISGDRGMGAMLGSYARMLARQADLLDAADQDILQRHLCTLVALALGPSPVAGESLRAAHRAVQRQRVLAYIETHLRDPRVTAERTAYELAMSPRWLHALLEGSGESFAARLTRRRLEESCRLLNNPSFDGLSIAEVAFVSGFSDLSTFHRQFRRNFDMTPGEMRRLRPMRRSPR